MNVSLSSLVDNLSAINKKESENVFIDNMRYTMSSLSQSIEKVSDIDKKIAQIDKKVPNDKFIDNMRSTMTSLSQSIDKISDIDKKVAQINKKEPDNTFIELSEKFSNVYKFCNGDHKIFFKKRCLSL